ncbi:MAG: Lrp/AsnC ligand binding domain-containing protein [Solirubrobacteraceae bacterium]
MRVLDNGSLELDGIDKIILNSLMNDAKTPIAKIAKDVGVSSTAIHQRIKKLETTKLIDSTKVYINPKKLGFNTISFIGVYLDKSSSYKTVISELEKINEILESYYTTGNYSIFIKVNCRDNEHLMHILNHRIQEITGIVRTETFISLEQSINRQVKL